MSSLILLLIGMSCGSKLPADLRVVSPPFGHAVYARTATRREGPWSGEAKLFDVPRDSTYDATIHPELTEDGGRVQYIMYSRHIARGWFGAEHVAWRVEFAGRDAE